MTEREFVCWLRGYIGDGAVKRLTANQVKLVKSQLAKVVPRAPEKLKKGIEPRYHVYK
tara:strand:+ start:543 stop:716 length:174 start_codon:yes stop_codon:yes gene_type:complete